MLQTDRHIEPILEVLADLKRAMRALRQDGQTNENWDISALSEQLTYSVLIFIIDKAALQTENNHPVHILNNEGEFSTSSFIPFCSFGKDFIGTKINEFDVPVCDIFKPKHYYDQLCYETDLQNLKDSQKLGKQLKIGLTLVLDYNEERQTIGKNNLESESNSIKSFYQDDASSFSIFVDTISIQFYEVVISFNF